MASAKTPEYVKQLRYFFLNEEVHRLIQVKVRGNLAICYNYDRREEVVYLWSDLKVNAEPAYSRPQACKLLGISRMTMWNYEQAGVIQKPSKTWRLGIDPDTVEPAFEPGRQLAYRYSPSAILKMHDEILRVGWAKTIKKFPSREELIAKMSNKEVLYYRTEDGEFKPLWQIPKW
jgi:hypothetical protein